MAFAILLGLAGVPPSAQGQTFTVLHSFKGGTDGADPVASVILDKAGNLYGTTESGGPFSSGTVFKVDKTGKESVLYSFSGGADGAIPLAGLVRDSAGNLYGTTEHGGDLTCGSGVGCGTVFKLDKTDKETVLYSFINGADGSEPVAGVILDKAGNLYGTTQYGGPFSSGTVFKVDTTGKETVLYTFTGGRGGKDGYFPEGLIGDAAGNLYGITQFGGNFSFGTVFKLDGTGKETVLYRFTGGADGVYPAAGVIADAAGNLYGTTQYGGSVNCFGDGCGTVFKLDKTGKETVLYSFTGGTDGASPVAGLVRDSAGNLYGTATFGGDPLCSGGCGVVFKIAP